MEHIRNDWVWGERQEHLTRERKLMFILGYRKLQPKHILTTPGPAGTASTHGYHMDAKGQEQIHGDLSLRHIPQW